MAITTLHLLTSVAVSGGGAEPSVDQSRCGLEGQERPRRGVYVSYAPIWARSSRGIRHDRVGQLLLGASPAWEQARPRVSEAGRRRWEARGTCAINGAGASRTVPVTEHE